VAGAPGLEEPSELQGRRQARQRQRDLGHHDRVVRLRQREHEEERSRRRCERGAEVPPQGDEEQDRRRGRQRAHQRDQRADVRSEEQRPRRLRDVEHRRPLAQADLGIVQVVVARVREWANRRAVGDVVAHQEAGDDVRGLVVVRAEVARDRPARDVEQEREREEAGEGREDGGRASGHAGGLHRPSFQSGSMFDGSTLKTE
jgi:hypothetical protein